jgi:hypothetical protein
MEHAAQWATTVIGALALFGGGVQVVAKLTRIVDSIDHLTAALTKVGERSDDHEKRITTLEAHDDGKRP